MVDAEPWKSRCQKPSLRPLHRELDQRKRHDIVFSPALPLQGATYHLTLGCLSVCLSGCLVAHLWTTPILSNQNIFYPKFFSPCLQQNCTSPFWFSTKLWVKQGETQCDEAFWFLFQRSLADSQVFLLFFVRFPLVKETEWNKA